MLVCTEVLRQSLPEYKNPDTKIERLVKEGKLIRLKRGWYETSPSHPFLVAGALYGPSYISFESALGYYGLIPEAVYAVTSATMGKRKSKTISNDWRTFYYFNVPSEICPYGVSIRQARGYSFKLADPEKALCDKLYQIRPSVKNSKELYILLTENLRIEEEDLKNLSFPDLRFYSEHYPNKNVRFLADAVWKYC